jgi:hypothetical protein
MIIIGRIAYRSLACQRGSRLSIGISTALHILKAYSTVNTITENALNAANSQRYRPASSGTVSAANAMALRKIRTMMKPLTTRPIGWASPPTSSTS